MKQTFYHYLKNCEVDNELIDSLGKKPEHTLRTEDTIKQIKKDMKGNGAVLDAIYDEETESVTIYNKHCGYSKSDFYGNIL